MGQTALYQKSCSEIWDLYGRLDGSGKYPACLEIKVDKEFTAEGAVVLSSRKARKITEIYNTENALDGESLPLMLWRKRVVKTWADTKNDFFCGESYLLTAKEIPQFDEKVEKDDKVLTEITIE